MLLFLSHSGSDTEAAAELKRRILASPTAQDAGLRVWFDKDEIAPGDQWQPTLEKALTEADVFLVYVGSQGVVNWVDREVRMALTRATGPDAIGFFPVLASDKIDENILPPFARQFQTLTDPLADEAAMAKLVSAILGKGQRAVLTDAPFIGLRAMGEAEADRFFGRDKEITELVDLMRKQPLVAVVADSGAGKSSLVQAGLLPAFRGGALAGDDLSQDTTPRHVVTMRPGTDPIQGLRDGINEAARSLGRDAHTRKVLRDMVQADNPNETFYALACDIDHGDPDILLVVDQFEELLTSTPQDQAAVFVKLMLGLLDLDSKRVRVVLTVRADYVNLIRTHKDLFARITANEGAAQMRLKRMSDVGLTEVVERPLVMAGHTDAPERAALASAIKRDVTGRPGDLALVQMALYATWDCAQSHGTDLMTAYEQVQGVLGALAYEAEKAQEKLGTDQQALLLPLFARLVRLGDTGGATRRVALLSELGTSRASLARKLATKEGGRLLLIGDDTVEIAHEALVTQWPWLQNQMQEKSKDIRALSRLNDRATAWKAAGNAALPNEEEQRTFTDLQDRHANWLIQTEVDCLKAAAKKKNRNRVLRAAAIAMLVVTLGLSWALAIATQRANRIAEAATQEAEDARDRATIASLEAVIQLAAAELARDETEAALKTAAKSSAGGLVALSENALVAEAWEDATKLALGSWPRKAGDYGIGLMGAADTLSRALPNLVHPPDRPARSTKGARAEVGPNGNYYVYQSNRGAVLELRRVEDGTLVNSFETYVVGSNYAFSPDGRFLATTTRDRYIRLIDLLNPQQVQRIPVAQSYPTAVAFSADQNRLYVGYPDGTIETRDPLAPNVPTPFRMDHPVGEPTHMVVSADANALVVASRYGAIATIDLTDGTVSATERFDATDALTFRLVLSDTALLVRTDTFANLLSLDRLLPLTEIERPDSDTTSTRDIYAPIGRFISDNGAMVSFADRIWPVIPTPRQSGDTSQLASRMANWGWQDSVTIMTDNGPANAFWSEQSQEAFVVAEDVGSPARIFRIRAEAPLVALGRTTDQQVVFIFSDGTRQMLDVNSAAQTIWQPMRPADGRFKLDEDWRFIATYDQSNLTLWQFPKATVFDKFSFEDQTRVSGVWLNKDGSQIARLTASSGINGDKLAFLGVGDTARDGAAVDVNDPFVSSVDVAAFSDDGSVFTIAGGSRFAGWIKAFDTTTGERLLDARFQRARGALTTLTYTEDASAVRISPVGTDSQWFMLDGSNASMNVAPANFRATPRDTRVADFLSEATWQVAPSATTVLTPDRSRIAALDEGNIVILDTATGFALARFDLADANFIAMDFPDPGRLHTLTDDGVLGTHDLSDIATGNGFEVACGLLSDPSLSDVLVAFPVNSAPPICDKDYAPPLPEFGAEARSALLDGP